MVSRQDLACPQTNVGTEQESSCHWEQSQECLEIAQRRSSRCELSLKPHNSISLKQGRGTGSRLLSGQRTCSVQPIWPDGELGWLPPLCRPVHGAQHRCSGRCSTHGISAIHLDVLDTSRVLDVCTPIHALATPPGGNDRPVANTPPAT